MVVNNYKGLLCSLTVKKNAAPRCPFSASFSVHVRAMADLMTQAGPPIYYMDEGVLRLGNLICDVNDVIAPESQGSTDNMVVR